MAHLHPFTQHILQWYSVHARSLPWRQTRNPYAIWLSEIILQQTRVSQGEAYWHRFMAQYPTVEHLASASEDQVLLLWQGLGYYSRARNLHAAAKEIAKQGSFPSSFAELKKLKGVGDYTAAAIASIAFNEDVASVDGNVYRVLARYFDVHTPINSTDGKKQFALLAQQMLPKGKAGLFNQALMDFGSMVCTPSSPQCLQCPVQASCQGFHEKNVDVLPVKLKKTTIKTRFLCFLYLRYNGKVAIKKREKGDIWQGLYQFVDAHHLFSADNTQALSPETISKHFPTACVVVQNIKHLLTHRVLYGTLYVAECNEKPLLPEGYLWVNEDKLSAYAFPKLLLTMLEHLHKKA